MVAKLYRNKYNENKYIEVKHYGDGHYYWRQHMYWMDTPYKAPLVNYTGSKAFRRVRIKSMAKEVLEDDYILLGITDPMRGSKWSYVL